MLSEALRLIRVFHDLKQGELADDLGISKSYISELESGKKKPTLDIVEKYSARFNIPVSSILFFSENLEGKNMPSSEKTREYIASKVLRFLKLIEEKTLEDA